MGKKNNHTKSVKIRDRYIVRSLQFHIDTDIFILQCCVNMYRIGKMKVAMTVTKKYCKFIKLFQRNKLNKS